MSSSLAGQVSSYYLPNTKLYSTVIIFKNVAVRDFGYIVSSALLLIGNLSGLQTKLTAGGGTSYGSVQNQLRASLLPQGQHCMSAPVLLLATAWQ